MKNNEKKVKAGVELTDEQLKKVTGGKENSSTDAGGTSMTFTTETQGAPHTDVNRR